MKVKLKKGRYAGYPPGGEYASAREGDTLDVSPEAAEYLLSDRSPGTFVEVSGGTPVVEAVVEGDEKPKPKRRPKYG